MATSINSPNLSSAIRTDIPAINTILKALAKADPSILSDIENGTKRFYEGTKGWEFQELVSGSWVTRTKFNIDAQSVDGYNTSIDAVASTIVVRGTDKKIKGDLTGKADTAGTADKLASTLAVNAGGTGATTAAAARTNLGVPPTSHASSGKSYGTGTGSNYGHVKLSDSTSSTSAASAGIAASPKAVKTAKEEAISAAGEALEAYAGTQATKDAAQDEAIAAAQSSADAAQSSADAAQSSADAAQSSADAANAGLAGVIRVVNGALPDAEGVAYVAVAVDVASSGGSLILPNGGKWKYFYITRNSAGNLYSCDCGEVAGGSTVAAPPSGGSGRMIAIRVF